MHDDHSHHHHHHHDGGHHHHHPHAHPGHNRGTAQWQTPHLGEGEHAPEAPEHEADLDLVEKAFVEGFTSASDPTSFLRLAAIPFIARLGDGTELKLLRVTVDNAADIGALTPHLGGQTFRYDPLPAALASRRATLRFVYFDGNGTRSLRFEEVRALSA
ncbi:hypothetical protein [Acuticoccus kandeliae]|uniref:hypothetical protein n=1 Tax=Acuticoccus kandeliae TaxID=2073160 RepID=UPI000D3E0FBB|nr:hypothetical protein [Acuticoccus kandeliae]